jgi:hypothetical protein
MTLSDLSFHPENIPFAVVGYSSAIIWNCSSSRVPIGIWAFVGGQSQKQGEIAPQYVGNICGSSVSAHGLTVPLTVGTVTRVLATDDCDDPDDLDCIRAYVDVFGGTTLGQYPWNVG